MICYAKIFIPVILLIWMSLFILHADTHNDKLTVMESNNRFGFDLYHQYKGKEGNLFFSPFSIFSALTMTYEGAEGKTAQEMRTVLNLPDDKNILHAGLKSIYENINKKDKSYQLTTANALWAQKNYPFIEEYFKIVEDVYDGRVTNLDFKTKKEKARLTINRWVEDKTNDKIKDLIPQGILSPETRLVLTNAVYFHADWMQPFSKESTKEGIFTLTSGCEIKNPMMHQTGHFNYGETDRIQILEMDYRGRDLSMLIILPKKNNIGETESIFGTEKLNTWKKAMKYERVRVVLPKFKFETKTFMVDDLKEMGMTTAFTYPDADFTGMSPTGELYINKVIHQTFVEVAEYGTEAAAATAVTMKVTSAIPQEQPKIFQADHPFLFIIQQKQSGHILFMGRMSNPK